MFKKIIKAIEKYNRIIIHRHSNPDGDALGSQIGLMQVLKDNYPNKEVYIVGDDTKRYSFMLSSKMDNLSDEQFKSSLCIILDCGAKSLVCDNRFELAGYTIRIDHHEYVETFTDLELVDTSYESACGIVTDLVKSSNLNVSKIAATALFTGMVTDSGRFRYDATTPRTLSLASFLLSCNIDTNEIYRNLYSEDLEMLKIRSSFIQKITKYEHSNVAYIYNTKEDVEKLKLDTFTISRGMVNVMGDINGIDIWVNFTESEGKVLCELRSSIYNINPIAVKYGGGGHKKASGATLNSKEEAMLMLKDLKQLTEEEYEG